MDEGASMLRLLNLLEWPNNRTPELLCGPLHGAVAYFESHDTVPHEVALVYTLPAHSALVRCVVWRVNMLVHLINQAGVLAQYFPVQDRRGVLSRLQTCLDAMFPLLDKLEQHPALQLDEVYSQRLAPESTRQAVIDYSCTYFIRYLMPVVFGSKTDIPPIVFSKADTLPCLPSAETRTASSASSVLAESIAVISSVWRVSISLIFVIPAKAGNYTRRFPKIHCLN